MITNGKFRLNLIMTTRAIQMHEMRPVISSVNARKTKWWNMPIKRPYIIVDQSCSCITTVGGRYSLTNTMPPFVVCRYRAPLYQMFPLPGNPRQYSGMEPDDAVFQYNPQNGQYEVCE